MALTGKQRMLHTMLRVTDMERSVRFYTEVLGMKVLRRKGDGGYKNSSVDND